MNPIKRVAVVDDSDDTAASMINVLEDGEFDAYRQEQTGTIEELVDEIVNNSDAAVCDHRLRYGGFQDISGADLASRLIQREHPAILVTQYLDQDASIAIRRFRQFLPVVLKRENADEPEELRSAFARCILEISKGRRDNRKPQRTLLRVADMVKVGDDTVIDALVDGFSSKDAVRFPLSLVHQDDRDRVLMGVTLSALTNLRAEEQVDLYFEDVRLCDEPDESDGLE